MPLDDRLRALKHRARCDERQVRALRRQTRPQGPAHAGQRLGDAVALAGAVRDDAARRVRRGRRPVVGHQVQQGRIALVANRGDDGRAGVRDGAHEAFVGEGKEILDRAAAARDHDDVDLVHGVQLEEGAAHLGHAVVALHGDLANLETRGRPAVRRVDDHVVLRLRVAAADQADRARQEGEGLLAGIREQALGRQAGAQRLNLGQQIAHTLQVNLRGLQVEAARALPKHRLHTRHYARALGQRRRIHDARPRGHRHRRVRLQVAQRQKVHLRARTHLVLNDLALHPQGAHAVHVHLDVLRQPAQRPRIIPRRISRLRGGRTRLGRAARRRRSRGMRQCHATQHATRIAPPRCRAAPLWTAPLARSAERAGAPGPAPHPGRSRSGGGPGLVDEERVGLPRARARARPRALVWMHE